MTIVYAADWVLPISAAPISGGAVAVEDGRIIAVGTQTEISQLFAGATVKNFGEAAILPGLINVHAHLELTAMRGFLDSVESDFFRWLRKLTAARALFSDEDLQYSTLCGAIEAARAGVTCVGDIATRAEFSLQALTETGLRGVSFQEIINPNPQTASQSLNELAEKIAVLRPLRTDAVKIGVSPHAPYSVSRNLFELLAGFCLRERLPVSIHVAESGSEEDFVRRGTGIFAEFLHGRDIEFAAANVSSVEYLNQTGILQAAPLLAHCVNVDENDLKLIAATNSKIAHCPKSNAKFAHGVAPFADILSEKIAVGLGSDSVASNNVCDILDEARNAALMARSRQNFVTAEEILHAATLGGARALNLDNEIGSLEIGKAADLCVVSLGNIAQSPIFDVAAALVFASSARDVVQTIVAGRTIFDGEIKFADEQTARFHLSETARKIAGETI